MLAILITFFISCFGVIIIHTGRSFIHRFKEKFQKILSNKNKPTQRNFINHKLNYLDIYHNLMIKEIISKT